ncbi:ABC transporter permease [Advenella alkanexedens]|uniref:ABC transporter permease n=1 Tax=Advenella alkanexedens TaxID=1481665 RepID=A0ABS6NJC9_9BURK|nr:MULTISPECIES: ABC transporter permease [Advenella]MBV4395727.1 ABC transporter permease [Advenella alkanexedens]MDD3758142.1 ABC transporter permease [Advenella sp.]WKU18606.1 ABC transporter permease [Advenella alkanexedens]
MQADFLVTEQRADGYYLCIQGDWILDNFVALEKFTKRYKKQPVPEKISLDGSRLGMLDTVGASRLIQLLGQDNTRLLLQADSPLPAEKKALLQTVAQALELTDGVPKKPEAGPISQIFGQIGYSVTTVWRQFISLLGFSGLILESLFRLVWHPRQWRFTSVVAQVQTSGLNAVPIVMLLTFMVGAVIAFLGATVLADFGASVYTVHLVAFSNLREFAILLTAILMAGRTASAFTAQLGSMKVNEEIDALRASGLNPVYLLVIPRVLALLISLPILTFLGMLSGMLGGLVVCIVSLEISPVMFMDIISENVPVRHFWIGMVKAPIFAFVIAVVGCHEGFKVDGSAQSVGEHTTSSVVQCIFLVILLDALAALFFMEMGW